MRKFYGKCRGSVVNNIDPMNQGRLQVRVPAVLGEDGLSWAMPCVPFAGKQMGFFALPPVGANIWVEFEGGNPDHPIWTGCFWGIGELPTGLTPFQKLIKTSSITFTLDDTPGQGGISFATNSPATPQPLSIKFDSDGMNFEANPASLKLASSKIEIKLGAASVQFSPAKVDINNGALEIM